MKYTALDVRLEPPVCFIGLTGLAGSGAIDETLVRETLHVLEVCQDAANVVVFEGSRECFCAGADFQNIRSVAARGEPVARNPEPLYRMWSLMSGGPYVTVAHVRGKANAGGLGFVAAADVVLADDTATFGLSELLFGLFPACVLPFLVRRVGRQRANYLTLTTQPISAQQACAWGLVDAYAPDSTALLQRHLRRLRCLTKDAVRRYKNHLAKLDDSIARARDMSVKANIEIFSDPTAVQNIARYVETGAFPWEQDREVRGSGRPSVTRTTA
jgi:polyketide biosynthesis enoyl-CoA hydratase PksH